MPIVARWARHRHAGRPAPGIPQQTAEFGVVAGVRGGRHAPSSHIRQVGSGGCGATGIAGAAVELVRDRETSGNDDRASRAQARDDGGAAKGDDIHREVHIVVRRCPRMYCIS